MGFDKNDIMRAAELAVLALVGILMIFFVARPLIAAAARRARRRAKPGRRRAAPPITRIMVTPDGQQMQIAADGSMSQLALPGPRRRRRRIDMARVDGQVRQSAVKKVSEFVEAHPDESVAILRSWLHEIA
jgi:flagellar M-ring protein FliF